MAAGSHVSQRRCRCGRADVFVIGRARTCGVSPPSAGIVRGALRCGLRGDPPPPPRDRRALDSTESEMGRAVGSARVATAVRSRLRSGSLLVSSHPGLRLWEPRSTSDSRCFAFVRGGSLSLDDTPRAGRGAAAGVHTAHAHPTRSGKTTKKATDTLGSCQPSVMGHGTAPHDGHGPWARRKKSGIEW